MRRTFVFLALLIATGIAAAAELDETEALAVLQKLDAAKATDAELFDTAAACRRLTVIGTEKSVAALEPLLPDPKLGSYARTALQNIGGEKAEAALKKHPAKTDNASPIAENLMKAGIGKHFILKGDKKSLDMFVDMLTSDDRIMFNAALAAFREFPDRKIVDVMAKEQAGLKPERRVAALLSILDRKDTAPVPPEILEAAQSDANTEVRAAAIAVLGAFPDENSIRLLFQIRDELEKAAFEALATTKYPKINKIILEKLADENPNIRLTANMLAGERSVKAAEPLLWKSTRDTPWGSVQFTAFTALGRVVGIEGFGKLLDDYHSKEFEKIRAYIFIGLKNACRISADRSAYAKLIAEKLSDPAKRLELFAELGGDEALRQIAEIARKTDRDDIRDQATKILGEWTGAEVAPVLLELSASLTEEKYKVRTLRGFLRAVRQFEMPKEEKKKLCEKALHVATREEEKKLVRDLLSKL